MANQSRNSSQNQLPPLPGTQIGGEDIKPPTISKIVFNLTPKEGGGPNKKKMSTTDDTIPAGAFARAVLLGGVDASTSINAASDPRPVLLRVTDPGTLPRKLKSDLKNCHVLASSYGDLSSERVYMRLEKLTCTEPLTGEISETVVAGFVTGEDGRTGVRGTVVDKAGESVRNSALGGFLSGMSGFLSNQQQKSVFPVSPFGQTNALSAGQMLGAGASTGVGNAMEKYSEFFIKRAEQLQPILQIAAGREVNIVFTQGTKFGETSVKTAISNVRDASRQQITNQIATNPESAELPKLEESKL
jgi:conjugal transfer pilus assembly protein TraB